MAFDPTPVPPAPAPRARTTREDLVLALRALVAAQRPADPACSCNRCDAVRASVRLLDREDAA